MLDISRICTVGGPTTSGYSRIFSRGCCDFRNRTGSFSILTKISRGTVVDFYYMNEEVTDKVRLDLTTLDESVFLRTGGEVLYRLQSVL